MPRGVLSLTPPSDPRKDHGCDWRRKSTRIAGSRVPPLPRGGTAPYGPSLASAGWARPTAYRSAGEPAAPCAAWSMARGAVGSRPTSGAGARALNGLGVGVGRDLNVPRSWCVSCLSATPVTPGLACYSLRTRQMTLARDAALAGEAPGAMPGCTLQPPKAQRSESSA